MQWQQAGQGKARQQTENIAALKLNLAQVIRNVHAHAGHRQLTTVAKINKGYFKKIGTSNKAIITPPH